MNNADIFFMDDVVGARHGLSKACREGDEGQEIARVYGMLVD